MPKESIIKHYSSSTTGSAPLAGDLVEGELAINTADEKVFFKNLGGTVVDLASSKAISGAYAAKALPNTFTANQSFSAGLTAANGVTFTGPFTLLNGDTIYQTSGAFAGSYYSLYRKSRGTPSSPGTVVQGDAVGGFQFGGWDGSAWQYGSMIQGLVDGAVSSGTVPVNLRFLTSGSVRMIISSTGDVGIGTTTPTNRLTVSGNASVSGSLTAGTLFASNIVNSLNGLTGARTLTGDGGAVVGVGNDTIRARLATASLTGVASFSSTNFDVSAAGVVSVKAGGISNTNLVSSTISGVSLGSNLNALTIGTGLGGSSYNGSGAVTITNTGVLSVNGNTGAITNVAVTNATNTFTASQNFSAGLSGNLTGNATTATTATNSNSLGGTAANSWALASSIGNGTLTLNVSGVGLAGSQTFTANQSGNATFTVTSNATGNNVANTIVARDASGNFAAGTATLGALTVDTSTLHVDSTNDRVGIGTTSPTVRLDVNGSIQATGTIEIDGASDLYLNSGGSNVATIRKNETVRFDIYPLGGLNSASPFWRGMHLTPPQITQGGSNIFPRISAFYSYTNAADPTDLTFKIQAGNSTIRQDIVLVPGEASTSVIGFNNNSDQRVLTVANSLITADRSLIATAGLSGNLTGNASTATTWQTGRTITIGNTGKSVNGGSNVSWSLSEIGVPAANAVVNSVVVGGATLTGNVSLTAGSNITLTPSGSTITIASTASGGGVTTTAANTWTALQTFSVGISGIGATFSGHLSAATKSFVIPHPTVSGMKLHHGSLEGPENGVYVRGRAHGRTADLPHYWTGLVDESTITVQVTPFGRSQNLYVESVSIHQVVIGGDENPSYFYTVYGERKDVPKLKVEV